MHLRIVIALVISLSFGFCLNSCKQQQNNKSPEVAADSNQMEPLPEQEQKLSSLKMSLKVGQTLRYRLEQIETLVQDDSISLTSTTTAYYTKTVKTNSDGLMTFSMRYDSLKSSQSSRGTGSANKDLSFNSNDSNDRKNKDYILLASLIGEEVVVSVDSLGRILEVSGMSALVNRIAKNAQREVTDEEKAQISEQLRQIYYAQVIQQEEQSMPEKSLDSSLSWTKGGQQPMQPAFMTTMSMNYKINKLSLLNSRKVASIGASLVGSITLADKKYPVVVDKGTISGSGNSIVDVEQGYTIQKRAQLKQELQATAMNPQTKKKESFKQTKTTNLSVMLLK